MHEYHCAERANTKDAMIRRAATLLAAMFIAAGSLDLQARGGGHSHSGSHSSTGTSSHSAGSSHSSSSHSSSTTSGSSHPSSSKTSAQHSVSGAGTSHSSTYSSSSHPTSQNPSSSRTFTPSETAAHGKHGPAKAQGVQRDERGRIARSAKAKDEFRRTHPAHPRGKAMGLALASL
jgi:hypothetical protein